MNASMFCEHGINMEWACADCGRMTQSPPNSEIPHLKVVDFKPRAQVADQQAIEAQARFRSEVVEVMGKPNLQTAVFVSLNEDGSYSIRHVGSSRLEAVGILQMAAQMIVLRGMGG